VTAGGGGDEAGGTRLTSRSGEDSGSGGGGVWRNESTPTSTPWLASATMTPAGDTGSGSGAGTLSGVSQVPTLPQRTGPALAPVWMGVVRSTQHHAAPPQVGVVRAEKYEGWIVRPWGDNGSVLTVVGQTDTKTGNATLPPHVLSGVFASVPRYIDNLVGVAREIHALNVASSGPGGSLAMGGGSGGGGGMAALAAVAAALGSRK